MSENWYREYQVLTNRTHPTMQMHGASGYILSAIKTANQLSSGPSETPDESPDAKRHKPDDINERDT